MKKNNEIGSLCRWIGGTGNKFEPDFNNKSIGLLLKIENDTLLGQYFTIYWFLGVEGHVINYIRCYHHSAIKVLP